MIRKPLLDLLESHKAYDEEESSMQKEAIAFINAHPDCFQRSLDIGHITASAFIVNAERTHTLLLFHSKIKIWVQPGGHSDGDPDTAAVALKETEEETGLKHLNIHRDTIYDIDIHLIPERKEVMAHYHYDVRYLIEADMNEPLNGNEESQDMKWIPLSELEQYNESRSVLRMRDKVRG